MAVVYVRFGEERSCLAIEDDVVCERHTNLRSMVADQEDGLVRRDLFKALNRAVQTLCFIAGELSFTALGLRHSAV